VIELRVSVNTVADHGDDALMATVVDVARDLTSDKLREVSRDPNTCEVTVRFQKASDAQADPFVDRIVALSDSIGRTLTVTAILDDVKRRARWPNQSPYHFRLDQRRSPHVCL
jgi:hypothetical protein